MKCYYCGAEVSDHSRYIKRCQICGREQLDEKKKKQMCFFHTTPKEDCNLCDGYGNETDCNGDDEKCES